MCHFHSQMFYHNSVIKIGIGGESLGNCLATQPKICPACDRISQRGESCPLSLSKKTIRESHPFSGSTSAYHLFLSEKR